MIQFRYRKVVGPDMRPVSDWSEWLDARLNDYGLVFLEFPEPTVMLNGEMIEIAYRERIENTLPFDTDDDDSDAPWASDPEAWKR